MVSVGATLRAVREKQGRGIAEVADALCITQRYLRAIEEDDVNTLPGAFFYKNFVKQYAAIVGIDYAQLRPGVEALAGVQDVPTAVLHHPDSIATDVNQRHISNSRLGVSLVSLVAVIVGCSGFYAWWTRPAHVVSAKSVTIPVPAPTPATIQPIAAQSPAPSTAPVTVTATTTTMEDGINHVVLNLSAKEKTWLRITSEGKDVFSGILEASQTKTLSGLEVARMTVGNAGGIDVVLNGKSIGPIGPRGQVRVVVFTPDNFQILQPAPTPEAL